MTKDVILTADGLAKLKEELRYRTTEKREELRASLEENRNAGDLSENEGYHLSIEETQLNEARIAEIEKILATAKVSKISKTGVAGVGSTVTVECDQGNRQEYTLVGVNEANPVEGKISYLSPIGSALMDHKVGDTTKFATPQGDKKCKIMEVK